MRKIILCWVISLFLYSVNAHADLIGQSGLEHAISASVSQSGFYESAGFGYANTSNLLGASNTYQNLNGHLDFGYASIVKGLDLGITLYQNTFVLNSTAYHDNGDIWLTVKYGYDLKKWFSLGALVQPRLLSSASGLGFNTSATSYLGLLLFSFNLTDVSRFTPLIFHLNLGYYLDNSINLLDNPYEYNITGLYGLGVRGDNRLIGDLSLEGVALNNLLHPFIEVYTEQASQYSYYKASLPSLGNPSFMQNPFYITPGIKLIFPNRIYALAGVDIGLEKSLSDISTTTAYPYVPWSVYVEIGYKIISCKPTVVREYTMVKPATAAPAPAPAPVQHPTLNQQAQTQAPPPPPPSPKPAPFYKTHLRYAYINKLGMKIEITRAIHFKLGSAVIVPASYPILDDVVTLLKYNPEIHVRIEGYTDNIGSPAYNKTLSQKRAESVMDYLIQHGISSDRLTAIGFGEEFPIASNNTPAGRAKNRRVEFKIIKGQ
ncbi:MAG: OmpA family protein [bacterium]